MSIELQLKTLPNQPGVYQFFDDKKVVIYVGKAKNLKKRVTSYFSKEHTGKTKVLVSKIRNIKTTIVDTEYDALLLENNLIKEFQPRYNIRLKDDKTYPWICIKNEPFPKVFLTRKLIHDGSEYYGPYTSVIIARALLELVKSIYPLRSCSLDLKKEKILLNKFSVCLEFHIHNCLGPCEDKQSSEDYLENIQGVKNIIKGNISEPLALLKKKMFTYSKKMEFEQAQKIKDKLDLLEKYQAKSTIISPSISDVDVFGFTSDESAAYINYFKIIKGRIIQSYTTEIRKLLDETQEELLEKAIIDIRKKFQSISKEIFIPFKIDIEIPSVNFYIPKIGDKKKILDLSEKNAKEYRLEKMKQIKIMDPERHSNRIMSEMKQLLHLPKEPRLIEGFDNSNIQGTNPVSACVVFRNGKPSKAEYRIFNVKTVEGPNDFATMEEVIYRRYKRQLEEDNELPQLILIDGGKGQLSSAYKSLELLGLAGKIPIIGIAKRLEEIYFPHDPVPLYLDKTSETLKVLQQVRDEAHRYGITRHRNKRSKKTFTSELENINGIGEKSIQLLLNTFKSVQKIKEAPLEEIESIIGNKRALIIMDYFKKES
ncbi:excinuclease ABC subunit UvrC [Apibacter muscae]|uniref:UvrABC system protein C n=1 Tax=Apibacter muscae TaxID=2509004 RepID=A0A563D7X9_9FLAO|nr:excinuclease ABC subunit UvrC [Apibacter muscae]TWP26197.1 excinuclease ABC subunit UvrC [Apibacter muscae]